MADLSIENVTVSAVVEASEGPAVTVSVPALLGVSVAALGLQRPRGAVGPPGVPVRVDVAAAAAVWVLAHDLGRVPMVQVFLASGELVVADVAAAESSVSVTFAQPQAGFVILS